MNKKTVVLVANTSWSLYKFRRRLISKFVEDGYNVHLIAPEDDYVPILTTLGAEFHPLKSLKSKSTNPFHDLLLLKELLKLYQKIRPGIIFHYTIKPNIYGTFAAYLSSIPCIAVVTGLGYTFLNKGIVATIAKLLYKTAFNLATEVWFLNVSDLEEFTSSKLVTKEKAMVLKGEGIDYLHEFNPARVQKAQISPNKGIKFLFVGRLLYDKGLREYVEAAKVIKSETKDAQFNILGYLNVMNPKAVSENQLQSWTSQALIQYLGSAEDVRPIVLAHDCIVLPSYREGMSTVLQESASLGLPLIATEIPGCKELVDDEHNGYLCRPKDAVDLAAKIRSFLELTDEERKVMGRNSRLKIMREFNENEVFGNYLSRCKKYTYF